MNTSTLPISELETKIIRLGESKRELEGELTKQISALSEELNELKATQSLRENGQQHVAVSTKQRINELVKEIDDCLLLLNK
jgi:acetyl-CoA carboxylase alpha subunit